MKTTLLASSPTLDGIKSVIAKFYYYEKDLIPVAPNEWSIIGKNGTIKGVRVVLKGKRYRFESINN